MKNTLLPKVARAHHYIPEFYLAGFTRKESRDDLLWVHDREENKVWTARPKKVAHIRDYYRVEADDLEPDVLEKAFATFESEAAEALRRLVRARQVPAGDDLAIALNFVTLMVVRVPGFRDLIVGNLERLRRHKARSIVASPEVYRSVTERMALNGFEPPAGVGYDQMRAFIMNDEYAVRFDQTYVLQLSLELGECLLPHLAARRWSLVVAKEEAEDFICSDQPVALVPTSPEAPPFLGFGLACTEVSLPLSRRATLIGHYEGEPMLVEADSTLVGEFNHRTLSCAERFIFSPDEGCVFSVRSLSTEL